MPATLHGLSLSSAPLHDTLNLVIFFAFITSTMWMTLISPTPADSLRYGLLLLDNTYARICCADPEEILFFVPLKLRISFQWC